MSGLRQLGLVVHPTRLVDVALGEIEAWAATHDVAVGQVAVPGHSRPVADQVEAAECDLLLGVGGDGTALTALHAGAESSRPVLAIACGSLGVLTSVSHGRTTWALEEFAGGRWTPVALPALDVTWGEAKGEVAINDIAIIRDGPGQIIVSIAVDDVLYATVAGDGVVVATALGSSAYTMAVGGPVLAPGADAFVVTPVAPHGGSSPPLVIGAGSRVTLTVDAGRVGTRYELDGRRTSVGEGRLTIGRRPDYATLVKLADEEPRLSALRRHALVLDSPRVIAREIRARS
jgi:NAD+ kinase